MPRRTPSGKAVTAALLIGVFATGCSNKSDDADTGSSKRKGATANGNGQPSGPWKGKLVTVIGDWKELREIVKSHRGKVVVLDVWSTYCKPCVAELPNLAALQKKHGNDVVCIAVDVDYEGGEDTKPEKVQAEVEEKLRARFGMALHKNDALSPDFRLFIASQPSDDFAEAAGYDSPPTIFVYSKSGKLTKIDADSVNKNPPKAKNAEQIELSYEKHVNPVVEKLLKESDPKK